jgi:NAD(P)-dependent dehydrogenase (short-subunit alcohol dehydrogenase family)
VVFVSSIAGRLVLPFTGVYSSSKWAIEGLAESLSYEVRPFGVDVAIVEPGAYDTNIGNTMVMPDDSERLASYGDVAKLLDTVGAGLAQRLRNSPSEVGEAIMTLIAMPPGQRQLRTPVPADTLVEAINEATKPIQRAALESFGVSSLAAPMREQILS